MFSSHMNLQMTANLLKSKDWILKGLGQFYPSNIFYFSFYKTTFLNWVMIFSSKEGMSVD